MHRTLPEVTCIPLLLVISTALHCCIASAASDFFGAVSGSQLEDILINPGLLYTARDQYVYPLPDNRCSIQERIRLSSCEVEARQEWNLQDTDFYTESRKFCCYVWDRLRCQLKILQYCDPQYANELSNLSDRLYGDMCESHSRGSASCALRWWSITLIVIAGLLVIALIAVALFCCVQKRRRRRKDVSGGPGRRNSSSSSAADRSRTGSYTVNM
ncbi:hypothetical protein TYRP_003377 [Tyrophagus putrescentiae]|nr:hypothetical protein TYRP_003377 [Tyrophagus putrescentiae]